MGTGDGASSSLCTAGCGWQDVNTAVLSPLPLDVLSACLDLGGGSRWCWDKSSNIVCGQPTTQPPPLTLQYELPLESKCGYVCILLGVSEEGSDGPVRRN